MSEEKIRMTGYMRLPAVLQLFPVSRSTFLAGIKQGKYPSPTRLSKRCVAWKAEDIAKLLEKAA